MENRLLLLGKSRERGDEELEVVSGVLELEEVVEALRVRFKTRCVGQICGVGSLA